MCASLNDALFPAAVRGARRNAAAGARGRELVGASLQDALFPTAVGGPSARETRLSAQHSGDDATIRDRACVSSRHCWRAPLLPSAKDWGTFCQIPKAAGRPSGQERRLSRDQAVPPAAGQESEKAETAACRARRVAGGGRGGGCLSWPDDGVVRSDDFDDCCASRQPSLFCAATARGASIVVRFGRSV